MLRIISSFSFVVFILITNISFSTQNSSSDKTSNLIKDENTILDSNNELEKNVKEESSIDKKIKNEKATLKKKERAIKEKIRIEKLKLEASTRIEKLNLEEEGYRSAAIDSYEKGEKTKSETLDLEVKLLKHKLATATKINGIERRLRINILKNTKKEFRDYSRQKKMSDLHLQLSKDKEGFLKKEKVESLTKLHIKELKLKSKEKIADLKHQRGEYRNAAVEKYRAGKKTKIDSINLAAKLSEIDLKTSHKIDRIKRRLKTEINHNQLEKKNDVRKIVSDYGLYYKNAVTFDFGAQNIFAAAGTPNLGNSISENYWGFVRELSLKDHIDKDTNYFSLSGSVNYTRMLNRISFINVGISTRDYDDSFLVDRAHGIKPLFSINYAHAVYGIGLFKKNYFSIVGSAGGVVLFVTFNPLSDPHIQAEMDGLGRLANANMDIPRTNKPAGQVLGGLNKATDGNYTGAGLAMGLDFRFDFTKTTKYIPNELILGLKFMVGPAQSSFGGQSSLSMLIVSSADLTHKFPITPSFDLYYKGGINVIYIKDTGNASLYSVYANYYVSLNVGMTYKF